VRALPGWATVAQSALGFLGVVVVGRCVLVRRRFLGRRLGLCRGLDGLGGDLGRLFCFRGFFGFGGLGFFFLVVVVVVR
jgi:hypothetical protein